jgi:hypothetical protein
MFFVTVDLFYYYLLLLLNVTLLLGILLFALKIGFLCGFAVFGLWVFLFSLGLLNCCRGEDLDCGCSCL